MDALQGVFQAVALDYVLLCGIAILVALDTLRSGLGRAAALVITLSLAAFLMSLVPDTAFLASAISSDVLHAVAFGALIVALYFLTRRMGLEFLSGGMGQPLQAALAGVAVAAVATVVWLSVPALESYWEFGPQLQAIFAEEFRLFWLLGAYAALAVAR
jgi:hypothetical protein